MRCRVMVYVLLRAALFVSWMAIDVFGQPAPPADLVNKMVEVLRYTGVENPSPEVATQITAAWQRAQAPEATTDERQAAFREMYVLYSRLHGREVPPQTLNGLAQFAATTVDGGGRMDLRLPEPRGKPSGSYLHVESAGHGATPLLLISDLGIDGRKLYASFVQRQADAYRMSIVTLPYAGAAKPLPWPERLDYAARPWLTQIETELLALLDQPQMKGTVIVGTAVGGYFAARLALLRPQQVRAVVLVDALVAAPLRSLADPDAPASLDERLQRLRSVSPTPQLFPVAPVPPAEELRRLIADPKSTHPTARNWMAFATKDLAVSRAWTFDALSGGFFVPSLEYRWELMTTDLTDSLKGLAVPALAMCALHDEGSPAQSPACLSGWEEIRLLYPDRPLSVAAFPDTRSYISADSPAEFDGALHAFLAGRPVEVHSPFHLPRTSPRAEVMQSVGGAEIRIGYARPAVKERKIWGDLIPFDRVWRAGANEATTVTFSRNVRVEGHVLPAGAYTFFLLPRDDKDWTVIFNRVPRQWGAYYYNPALDALRVDVKPEAGDHEEWLSYRIETLTRASARVSLAWERMRVSFRVEVEQD